MALSWSRRLPCRPPRTYVYPLILGCLGKTRTNSQNQRLTDGNPGGLLGHVTRGRRRNGVVEEPPSPPQSVPRLSRELSLGKVSQPNCFHIHGCVRAGRRVKSSTKQLPHDSTLDLNRQCHDSPSQHWLVHSAFGPFLNTR